MPFLIIGTQTDLREDMKVISRMAKYKQKPVTTEQGESLARSFRVKYVECSALTQRGLKNVFDEAILTSLNPPNKNRRRRRCTLL